MPVDVKVCGLSDARSLAAAVEGGARWLGFIFYPPSPRAVTAAKAADLAASAPAACIKVGVLVDPDDALLDEILGKVPLDCLQLHGTESPARVAAIKARTASGRRVGRPSRPTQACAVHPSARSSPARVTR